VAELLIVALTAGAVVIVLRLVLQRKLLVKYAVLWITVSIFLTILAALPEVLGAIARFLGFAVPANFLFALSIGLLLGITLQISFEVTSLEGRIQNLAEEVALLRMGAEKREASGVES
jgi:hypothetical protein